MHGLQALPVEACLVTSYFLADYCTVQLIYDIQLLALSEHLPYVSRRFKDVLHSSPNSFRAQYITRRVKTDPLSWPKDLYTEILRFRLCTPAVLDIICIRCAAATGLHSRTDVPKHVFKTLLLEKKNTSEWTANDSPLPYLRHLVSKTPQIPPINVNAHSGFALVMAVHSGFLQLIRYLLDLGADPRKKDAMAVIVAIRKKDLKLVRMLVEPTYGTKTSSKRRRIPDRVDCSQFPDLLKVAVKRDARDIVVYLRGKGSVPDLETIWSMQHI